LNTPRIKLGSRVTITEGSETRTGIVDWWHWGCARVRFEDGCAQYQYRPRDNTWWRQNYVENGGEPTQAEVAIQPPEVSAVVETVGHAETLAELHHLQRKIQKALTKAREAVEGPDVVSEDYVNAFHNLIDDLT
jgi:hypothetical protein